MRRCQGLRGRRRGRRCSPPPRPAALPQGSAPGARGWRSGRRPVARCLPLPHPLARSRSPPRRTGRRCGRHRPQASESRAGAGSPQARRRPGWGGQAPFRGGARRPGGWARRGSCPPSCEAPPRPRPRPNRPSRCPPPRQHRCRPRCCTRRCSRGASGRRCGGCCGEGWRPPQRTRADAARLRAPPQRPVHRSWRSKRPQSRRRPPPAAGATRAAEPSGRSGGRARLRIRAEASRGGGLGRPQPLAARGWQRLRRRLHAPRPPGLLLLPPRLSRRQRLRRPLACAAWSSAGRTCRGPPGRGGAAACGGAALSSPAGRRRRRRRRQIPAR
mmetsp:Transcript_4095/g.17145  ORF Transcript_4095/g.17145 Transcript_4095/m.17145 type:complete len:329 (-) Transcript_4095:173-1159(-)